MPTGDPLPVVIAAAVLAAAFAIAAGTWAGRRCPARRRRLVLIGACAALFALPWFVPREPVLLKALVTLGCCAVLAPKLLDAHVGAGYWRDRSFVAWLRFLPNPFILVPRLQAREPVRPVADGVRRLARGAVEVALGAVLLWIAFRPFAASMPFWLEHTVKLIATYLLVFDGMFVLATGALRLAGVPVMEFSRHPVLASTPADFWRRYNRDAGLFLRADVFTPLGGRRAPERGILIVFLLNGLLHEYLAFVLIGRVTGYQLAFFAVHGIAAALTRRARPRGWRRALSTVATILLFAVTSVFFFATIDCIIPWYAAR